MKKKARPKQKRGGLLRLVPAVIRALGPLRLLLLLAVGAVGYLLGSQKVKADWDIQP